MPSPHRRVGLVVDDLVGGILDLFRERAEPAVPAAKIARRAVVKGALVEATLKVARSDAPQRERAAELVAGLAALVPGLPLPGLVKDELLESLSRSDTAPSRAERRRRQLALVRSAGKPEDDSQTAQDLAETFDAFERLPAR
ncbi:MAG TPA: hypothetical protein VI318_00775 [Baekduia sp.]